MGDETFIVCDFGDLAGILSFYFILIIDKLKVGNHIIVDFGSACLKVTGFESEPDFLASKCPDSEVNLCYTYLL